MGPSQRSRERKVRIPHVVEERRVGYYGVSLHTEPVSAVQPDRTSPDSAAGANGFLGIHSCVDRYVSIGWDRDLPLDSDVTIRLKSDRGSARWNSGDGVTSLAICLGAESFSRDDHLHAHVLHAVTHVVFDRALNGALRKDRCGAQQRERE